MVKGQHLYSAFSTTFTVPQSTFQGPLTHPFTHQWHCLRCHKVTSPRGLLNKVVLSLCSIFRIVTQLLYIISRGVEWNVQVTTCPRRAFWSGWIVYLMSLDGGRPVPFTTIVFTGQLASLPTGSQFSYDCRDYGQICNKKKMLNYPFS